MKVSLNWIRWLNDKYGSSANPAPDGVDKLVEKIGAQLGAVDEIVKLGEKYKGIVVAKVVGCHKHSNADKLTVCLIDDSQVVKGLKRDAKGLVEVVCGAPNVAAGQLIAWIPPGVIVPSTIGKEPLKIEAREIRGVLSNGMIASAKELDLYDDHSGILVIDVPAKPGEPLAKVYDLDDTVIDIENKMFTHRPDLFGMLGIARELAGINHHVFKSPSWYKQSPPIPKPSGASTHKLTVKNNLSKLVPRFCAVVIKDIKVGPSPVWLKVRLSSVGVKPINNIVDMTNFLMFETAQPLHAYDYGKLAGSLETRAGKKGEKLQLLGGKTIELDEEDIIIGSGGKAIGLGGIMGGAETEVSDSTTTIVLECANFNMNAVRQSAMNHGLFTEAATRFTKNQSPKQNLAVIVKAIEEIKKLAGGRQAGPILDDKSFKAEKKPVTVSDDFINQRLGLELSASQIKKLLENVEFEVTTKNKILQISVPFWRTDIEIAEDIVEEVGRLWGYDHLPLVLPKRDLDPAKLNDNIELKNQIRESLAAAGANEVLTYSFVHGSLLEAARQKPQQSFHLKNALSPQLQYYRQALVPSLLEKVHANIKADFNQFVFFEIGLIHIRGMLDQQKLPVEFENLALVLAAKQPKPGAPYYHAKKYLEFLLDRFNINSLRYSKDQDRPETYEPARSAWVFSADKMLGVIGEPSHKMRSALKLPEYTAQFEINLTGLNKLIGPSKYQSLNRFPALEQDICLRLPADIPYTDVDSFINQFLQKAAKASGYHFQLQPIDIFQRPRDKNHKQITFRISLEHPQRTLTNDEANRLLDILATDAKSKLKAERI